MADHNQPVIIIRRKKKGGHGGHHGGAWKVAYADFVTAMMSFFLLMWLLNTTTSDQRKGIADYFSPIGISQSAGGSGGVMGGTSIAEETGAEISSSSPPGVDSQVTATVGKGQEGDEDIPGRSEKGGGGAGEGTGMDAEAVSKDAAAFAAAMKREDEKFKDTERQIMRAIGETPGLQGLGEHLVIDRTPEGLRIQIIDRDKFSLFPSGASVPYEKGRDLLRLVGKVIARLPNQISITGHTDSAPFAMNSRRDNWDLSSERANVSRSEIVAGGVSDARIARVVGLADRDPYVVNDPKDSRNRRISIVLLRQGLSLKEPKTEGASPTPSSSPAPGAPPL